MAYEYLQESFQGGVLSERLRGRLSADLYRAALDQCSDIEITPQGSICRRPGSIFVADLGDDPRVRLVPFPQSDGQDYLLVLSHEKLSLFSLAGALPFEAGASGLSFLVNGDFTSGPGGLASWTKTGNSGGADATVTGADLKLYSATDDHSVGVYQDFTPSSTVAATLKIVWKAKTGFGARVDVKVKQGSTTIASWSQVPVAGSATEIAVNLTSGLTYRLSIVLYLPFGVFQSGITIDWVSLTASSGGGSPAYDLSAPWTAEQLKDVRWAAEPGRDRIYFVHPNVAPWFLTRSPATGAWTWQAATFNTAPTEWTGTSWPEVAEVYQSRLWLAKGNTLWASKSLDPFDFRTHETLDGTDQVLPSSAIAAPISTKGRIRWLHGRNMLLVGTDVGEYSVTAGGGVITPSDMQVRAESGFGSSATEAVDIGAQVLYVSRDQRKVRAIDYSQERQAWQSRDLTFVAEHLTAAKIAEAHFARDPNGTIALRLADGSLVACTYHRDEQVAAWWAGSFGGEITSAAVVHGPDGSVVYTAVQRASGVLLELVPMSESYPGRVYCDSAKTVDVSEVDTSAGPASVSGFDHLEGETVEVLLDGAIEGQQTVASGAVTISRAGATLTVGLPYVGLGKTLPPAAPLRTGGHLAPRAKRRWNRVFLRLNRSALPKVNGDRVSPDRSVATPLDAPEPLRTGDFGGPVSSAWEDRGALTIEMDLPLRTEVLCLFGSMDEGEV